MFVAVFWVKMSEFSAGGHGHREEDDDEYDRR